jgi:HK97 family phage portal protein
MLLDNPNPVMSRFELFEQTIGFLELTGNAYWFIAGDARGRPAQIWSLRPDRVTIVPHPQHYVAGYIYEIDGQRIPLEAVEVVHFKRWHPANDYYGLSALEAARIAVDSDRAMARWNKNTFGQDNGVPAGIVNIKEFISDSDFERIKREWRGSYGNAQRKTAFLRGGAVEWQNIGLSHADLDFLKGRKAHREEIPRSRRVDTASHSARRFREQANHCLREPYLLRIRKGGVDATRATNTCSPDRSTTFASKLQQTGDM